MRSIAILPTYNERDNLLGIVDGVLSADPNIHVLIVDDASPDGTGVIADNLCLRSSRVHVLHRTGRRGRGYAGLDGFKLAVQSGYDVILEMDADHSHPPEAVPRFLEAIRSADVVIGSRFMSGAKVDRGWGRKLVSRAANAYIGAMLRLPVKDASSGYRAFRREALEKIGLERMVSRGPSVLQEMLIACVQAGLRIREIPVDFRKRRHGRSKLDAFKLADSLFRVASFRLKRNT